MNCSRKKSTPLLLSEQEEQLLVRYFDGESSWWESRKAKKLVGGQEAARAFMHTLEVISEIAKNESCAQVKAASTVDLWSRINARIEEEERAALYLGKRRTVDEPQRRRFFSRDHFTWGISGGVVTACVTYFLVVGMVGTVDTTTSKGGLALNNSARSGYNQASYHPSRIAARRAPHAYEVPIPESGGSASIPSAVEVDWVRSQGRVRMIQEPGDRSAIIWVKRHDNPTFVGSSQGGMPLVVYQDRAPQSIPVVNLSR